MHIQLALKKGFLFCLGLLLAKICLCQTVDTKSISNGQLEETRQNNFGIEIIASILPPAKITRQSGNYELSSRLQSSYDIGINYLHSLKNNFRFSAGFHFVFGKRNFFANIPSSDINNWDGRNIIEDKELWGSFRIPFLFEKMLNAKKPGRFNIGAGFTLRYSGQMTDESNESILVYPPPVSIFNAEISARNNGKPWVTFLGGLSKPILLNNKKVLSIGVQADISTADFLTCNYEITIPNKPITSGTCKINGSSVGLSVQFIF